MDAYHSAMHHSWWKFTYMLCEPSVMHLMIKAISIVNKKGVEIIHYVCLSCQFDMVLFHVLGQEVPQLILLMMLLYNAFA